MKAARILSDQTGLSLKNTTVRSTRRHITSTLILALPMKVGTPIPGLDFMKDSDPPVSKDRSEYPTWVESLSKPLISLSKLNKMEEEDATDGKLRYVNRVTFWRFSYFYVNYHSFYYIVFILAA